MASSILDPLVFSTAFDYISAMLSLSGPISLPQIFHHVKLSPFSNEIGDSVYEFELFLLNRPQHFRVKIDVKNVYRFEGKISNKVVSLNSAFIVPVVKGNSPKSKENKVLATSDENGLKIKKKCKRQLPLSKKCEDVVISHSDVQVPDVHAMTAIKSQKSCNSDSFINKGSSEISSEHSRAGVLTLCRPTSNTIELAKTIQANPAAANFMTCKGGIIIEELLLKRGPLSINRLQDYLLNIKASLRSGVKTSIPKLLKFLIADDRFSVEGDGHVVSLNTQVMSKPISQLSVNESTQAVCKQDVCEGVTFLRNVLIKNGPLPVNRLVGHLNRVKQSVREAVGRNAQKLLEFLKGNDEFTVNGTKHVVHLKNSYKCELVLKEHKNKTSNSTLSPKTTMISPKCVEVHENNCTTATKSKRSVRKQVKVCTSKSLTADPNPCPEQIHQNVSKDLLQVKLRRGASKIVTQTILEEGPISLDRLEGCLKQTTLSFKNAYGESFPHYLNFLLHRNKFVINDVTECKNVKLESIVSLNPEWQKQRLDRQASKIKRKDKKIKEERKSCNTLIETVHTDASPKQKLENIIHEYATTLSPADLISINDTISALLNTNTPDNFLDELTSAKIYSHSSNPELHSNADSLVKDCESEGFFEVKSMRFKTLESILLNCHISECQTPEENVSMLLKFVHEQDFVFIKGNQVVGIKKKSESSPTCCFSSVTISYNSAEELRDTSKLTNDSETGNGKLSFMEKISKYVTKIIRKYGPVSMDLLKQIFMSKLGNSEYYGVSVDDFLMARGNVFVTINNTVYLVHSKEYISLSVKSAKPLNNEEQISTPPTEVSCPVAVLQTQNHAINPSIYRPFLASTNFKSRHPHPYFGLRARRNADEMQQEKQSVSNHSLNQSMRSSFGLNPHNKTMSTELSEHEIKESYKTSQTQQMHNRYPIPNPERKLTTFDEQRQENIRRRNEHLLPPINGRYRSFFSKLGLVSDVPPDGQKKQSDDSRCLIPSSFDMTGDGMCQKVSNETDEIALSPDQSSSHQIASQTFVNSKFSHDNVRVNNQICISEYNKLISNGDLPSTGMIGRVLYPWE